MGEAQGWLPAPPSAGHTRVAAATAAREHPCDTDDKAPDKRAALTNKCLFLFQAAALFLAFFQPANL